MNAPQRKVKRNRFVPLLVTLGVLAAAAVLLIDPFGWRRPSDEEIAQKDPGRRLLVDTTKEKVTAIEIDSPTEDAFTLKKEADRWYLVQGEKKYTAAQEKIDDLLEQVPGLRSESIATDKEEGYADMEVSDDKAIRVTVYSGETATAKLLVGKSTPGYNSSFVRLDGGKEVYRSSKNVKTLVGFTFRDFRSRTPWKFDPLLATKVSVVPFVEMPEVPEEGKPAPQTPPPTEPGEMMVFTKDEDLWKLPDGNNGNQNLIKELLKSFTELSVTEFSDTTTLEQGLLPKDRFNLSVESPTGTYTLTLGGRKNSNYFAVDQDGYVYQVGEYPLKFYRELEFDKLSFDDTPKEAAKSDDGAGTGAEPLEPEEGTTGDLPSDKDEGK